MSNIKNKVTELSINERVRLIYKAIAESIRTVGATGQIKPDFHSVWYDRMAGVFVEAIKEIDNRLSVIESGVL